jgi:hypothetical protein
MKLGFLVDSSIVRFGLMILSKFFWVCVLVTLCLLEYIGWLKPICTYLIDPHLPPDSKANGHQMVLCGAIFLFCLCVSLIFSNNKK